MAKYRICRPTDKYPSGCVTHTVCLSELVGFDTLTRTALYHCSDRGAHTTWCVCPWSNLGVRAAAVIYDQASLIAVQKHNLVTLFCDFGETGSVLFTVYLLLYPLMFSDCSASVISDLHSFLMDR